VAVNRSVASAALSHRIQQEFEQEPVCPTDRQQRSLAVADTVAA
jgi:hypothetical protein